MWTLRIEPQIVPSKRFYPNITPPLQAKSKGVKGWRSKKRRKENLLLLAADWGAIDHARPVRGEGALN